MTIAIIDKYPILRQGLTYLLKGHFADLTVIELENGSTKEYDHPSKGIDLVIMGLSQPKQAGNLAVINDAKRGYPLAKLIAYDETPDPSMVLKYFSAGVNGYLSKQAPIQKLVDCIDDVLERKRYISQEIMDLVLDWYPQPRSRSLPSQIQLPPRQYLIAKHLSQGRSTSWIAKELGRKASTISTTKSKIFQKLQIDNILKLREQMDHIGIKGSNSDAGTFPGAI